MGALLSWPDRSLTASLSGGSWQATAPLSNLLDPMLTHVSRSTDTLAASTIILSDLAAAFDIRVISLCAHSLSLTATIRVRGYSDSGYTTMIAGADTGTVNAWPAGFTAQDVVDYPKNWTFCFSSLKTARYWKWELVDTTNPTGYIEVGRVWHGEAFEPATGINYGSSMGYESTDVIEESLGGIPWGEKRTPRRPIVATFPNLTPAERRRALIMQKKLTTTDELFWVANPAAIAEDMLLDAFPGYMRKLSPLTAVFYNNNELPIEIIERV